MINVKINMTNIYLNLINIFSHIIHRVEGYDGALIPIIIFVVVITGKKKLHYLLF